MADKPFLVVENQFKAPPAYVKAWLTDVREDDRKRWFGEEAPIKILEKRAGYTKYTQPNDMGMATIEVVSDADDRWHAAMIVHKGERITMKGTVRESVRPGPIGTQHRAELTMEPTSFFVRLMMPMMRGKVEKELKGAFGRMKTAMEEEAAAGKSPTA
ncbi:MAG TPA: hypothetical protein VI997_01200 [Candidatus Thermoplasmatota archaeon]|nr:hypothetical protein [Candidatus Thermoplasmatota archaeon]